jgi:hypothetical protein
VTPNPTQRALALTKSRPRPPSREFVKTELEHCAADPVYFIMTYCFIYDNEEEKNWIPFALWPEQAHTLTLIMLIKFALILKARQLGLTWLVVCYAVWCVLYRPIAEVLLFSQEDREAKNLLVRIRGIYDRLPDWMQLNVVTDAAHDFRVGNGSRIQALPASAGGRSNAATLVIIDEADYVEHLEDLIAAAKPTVDAGDNQMFVLSTVNVDTPNSYFQRLCKASIDNPKALWKLTFLGWFVRPSRTRAWYERECEEAVRTTGTLDKIYKEYPETAAQALSPRSLNKRFPPEWIVAVSAERKGLPLPPDAPAIPGLTIFKLPEVGHTYGIGLDPAGGVSDGDFAVAQVVDALTKEQVAVLAGQVEPTEFANYVADLSAYYHHAPVLFEMNNHGQATLSQLRHRKVTLRYGIAKNGLRGNTPGWLTLERNKHMLYDVGAKIIQQQLEEARLTAEAITPLLFDFTTIAELGSIENTYENPLRAPEGQHDDRATAWVLAQMCVYQGTPSMFQIPHTGLWDKPREAAHVSDKLAQLMAGTPSRMAGVPVSAEQDGVPLQAEMIDEEPWQRELRRRGR